MFDDSGSVFIGSSQLTTWELGGEGEAYERTGEGSVQPLITFSPVSKHFQKECAKGAESS